jgi:hypothetical protein
LKRFAELRSYSPVPAANNNSPEVLMTGSHGLLIIICFSFFLVGETKNSKTAPHPAFSHLLLKEKEKGCNVIKLKISRTG